MLPHLSFVLDVVGACLLLIMILYAIQLNRRLNMLQGDKVHLQRLIASFDESTGRANASVTRLRTGAAEAAEVLRSDMAKATELRDDLAFLIDRASAIADRIEAAGTGVSMPPPTRAKSGEKFSGGANGREKPRPARGRERELLRALDGVR